jgi:arginine N-succinyltransferase
MNILRPVTKSDTDDLVKLAEFLDTVNFPNDPPKIEEGLHCSIDSFSGKRRGPEATYQFAVEDAGLHQVVGVSKIIAHHGTPEAPHYFWQIFYDRRESKTIHIRLTHQVLRLGKDVEGHTEIAGIVVHPQSQGKQFGKQLFYVRLLYMALHRENFLDRVISELLPPLDHQGRSVLWEAYGRKFTGLTYQEADRLSHDNKEFIEALFPQHEIYTCLLPPEAQEVIGKVGPSSLPAKHLAEKNGFQFLQQIDPFDGGPHFGCATDEILALKNTRIAPVARGNVADGEWGLACNPKRTGTEFRAVQVQVGKDGGNRASFRCTSEVFNALDLQEGELLAFLPYPTN